jgi:hypothetical protein
LISLQLENWKNQIWVEIDWRWWCIEEDEQHLREIIDYVCCLEGAFSLGLSILIKWLIIILTISHITLSFTYDIGLNMFLVSIKCWTSKFSPCSIFIKIFLEKLSCTRFWSLLLSQLVFLNDFFTDMFRIS